MLDYKNIGMSKIKKIQINRKKRLTIDCEFIIVVSIVVVGMISLIINW